MNKKLNTSNIITELGLSDLPRTTQLKLLTQMTESVLKRITVEVLEKLSEEDRKEFEKIQEKGDTEAMDKFLKEKIANYEEIVEGIVADFKEEMKKTIASLKSKNI